MTSRGASHLQAVASRPGIDQGRDVFVHVL